MTRSPSPRCPRGRGGREGEGEGEGGDGEEGGKREKIEVDKRDRMI